MIPKKKLGFGLMRLPLNNPDDQKDIDFKTLDQMVDTFLERGFTYFDTAYMYHDFTSELALKRCLIARHPREKFTMASKLPAMLLKSAEDQERIFNEQLEKCGVDYFDYYLVHNVNAQNLKNIEPFKSFDFIREKKEQGRIRHIGFSFHDTADLLDKVLTEHPEAEFVQLQINYLDWDSESIQSRRCLEVARKHKKPVVVMEPVKGGTLAKIPAEVEKLFKDHAPDLSTVSWAIRYAASQEGVMTVLSGMSNMDQLLDNTSYMQDFKPLDATELDIVAKAVDIMTKSAAIPCTVCRYCTKDCPKQIPIPNYFSMYNDDLREPGRRFSLQKLYYTNLTQSHSKASDCVACGRCEKSCPQHIKIIGELKKVAAKFEG